MKIRNRHHFAADTCLLIAGTVVAYLLRFEGSAGWTYLRADAAYLLLSVPLRLSVFVAAGSYRTLWRYAGSHELARLAMTGVCAACLNVVLGVFILPMIGIGFDRIPLSILALDACVTIGAPAMTRLFERRNELRRRWPSDRRKASRRRLLIAGAGEAGRLVVDEIKRNPAVDVLAVGYLDDDRAKHGQLLGGIRVLGGTASIAEMAEATRATDLIIAMPTASGDQIRRIVEAATLARLETRTVPAFYELVSGRLAVTTLRKLRIEDLLRREPIHTDLDSVRDLIRDRCVMVTGAGGSIGSELCRQVAGFAPKELLLVGHGENSIFEIQGELRRRFPEVAARALIADIRDRSRLAQLFTAHRPAIVFHAAAHKHVPLMEENPAEAITNNVLGTRNVTELAALAGVERLVLISTDKAVRPTSVMGASKRVAEQLVHSVAQRHGTTFVSVRFGNVLGSRGSVVPTFMRQIEAGGPITLTDPEVRRFFMTIPEAVQLVLQASVLAVGGGTFALDMGQPVKIVDLAHDLIRLSGLEPGRDIDIVFTGLRPGEKLYEEVFFEGDSIRPTSHPKILWTETPHPPQQLSTVVSAMERAVAEGADATVLRRMLTTLVPDFAQPVRDVSPAATPPRVPVPVPAEPVGGALTYAGRELLA